MITKKDIEKILKTIPDPELGISIWDLGLIYGIDVNKTNATVTITMTLTSIGCPLYSLIADPIKLRIAELKGIKNVYIELTFEPAWTPDKMSTEAKMQLGIL